MHLLWLLLQHLLELARGGKLAPAPVPVRRGGSGGDAAPRADRSLQSTPYDAGSPRGFCDVRPFDLIAWFHAWVGPTAPWRPAASPRRTRPRNCDRP